MDDYHGLIAKKLLERKENHSFRELKSTSGLTDFSSNDYLGFARSSDLKERIDAAWKQCSFSYNGAGGARLISGNFPLMEELEKELSAHFHSEAALLFNSGYSANLGLLASLPQKGDIILYDSLVHASVRDGIRLSVATAFKFQHNDLQKLEQLLVRHTGKRIWVVLESIYSMDGDMAPLKEISTLCKKYKAAILLDEAHATGVRGKAGEGLAVEQGLENEIFGRVITFGKAMGLHGAAVLGSEELKQYLVNFSRPFIYTTAMPPHQVLALKEALRFMQDHISYIADINQIIKEFREGIKQRGLETFFLPSVSPIQVFLLPGNREVKELSGKLLQAGFDVKAILHPTVPEGTERLRICLHRYNTEAECRALLNELSIYKS